MAKGNNGKSYHTPTTEAKHVSTTTKRAFLQALNGCSLLTPELEAKIDKQVGMPVCGAIAGSAFDPDRELDLLDCLIEDVEKEPTTAELSECERELAEEAA